MKKEIELDDVHECEKIKAELVELLAAQKEEGDEKDVKLLEDLLALLEKVCENESAEAKDAGASDAELKDAESSVIGIKISKMTPDELKKHLMEHQMDQED